jgi:hypothetical protein
LSWPVAGAVDVPRCTPWGFVEIFAFFFVHLYLGTIARRVPAGDAARLVTAAWLAKPHPSGSRRWRSPEVGVYGQEKGKATGHLRPIGSCATAGPSGSGLRIFISRPALPHEGPEPCASAPACSTAPTRSPQRNRTVDGQGYSNRSS